MTSKEKVICLKKSFQEKIALNGLLEEVINNEESLLYTGFNLCLLINVKDKQLQINCFKNGEILRVYKGSGKKYEIQGLSVQFLLDRVKIIFGFDKNLFESHEHICAILQSWSLLQKSTSGIKSAKAIYEETPNLRYTNLLISGKEFQAKFFTTKDYAGINDNKRNDKFYTVTYSKEGIEINGKLLSREDEITLKCSLKRDLIKKMHAYFLSRNQESRPTSIKIDSIEEVRRNNIKTFSNIESESNTEPTRDLMENFTTNNIGTFSDIGSESNTELTEDLRILKIGYADLTKPILSTNSNLKFAYIIQNSKSHKSIILQFAEHFLFTNLAETGITVHIYALEQGIEYEDSFNRGTCEEILRIRKKISLATVLSEISGQRKNCSSVSYKNKEYIQWMFHWLID